MVVLCWEGLGDVKNWDIISTTRVINANSRLPTATRSLVSKKYTRLQLKFLLERCIGFYFMFTQLKATLRAGWKGAEVGGERAEDREAISWQTDVP